MSFNISVTFNDEENAWMILPQGDMDIYTSTDFKDKVLSSFEDHNADLIIDGQGLNYIDSTGLGALIGILKQVGESSFNVYLDNIKPNIRKLFTITELDKLFIIRGGEDE